MLILSDWQILLGSTTILSPTEWLEGELVPPSRTATYQPKRPMRADFVDRLDRGLIEHQFSFRRVVKFPTCLAARWYAMAHLAELPTEPSTCLIYASPGGGVWTLARAVLTSYQPIVDGVTFRATYTIAGGQYQQTTTPVDDSDPFEPGPTADSDEVTADRDDITADQT